MFRSILTEMNSPTLEQPIRTQPVDLTPNLNEDIYVNADYLVGITSPETIDDPPFEKQLEKQCYNQSAQ
jgi:hypothetical protein